MNDEHSNSTRKPGHRPETFWQLVGRATMLGWDLVVPIVGGALLGRYFDDLFDKEFTWTVSLLALGVIVAFHNLYTMYVEQGGRMLPRKRARERRPKEHKEDQDHAQEGQ